MVAGASSVALRPEALLRPVAEVSRPSARLRTVPAAFDALVRDHGHVVRALGLRLAGTEVDADDLVQDCLERAMRRFDTLTPGTNARAWLLTILHNAFIDRCRRRTVDKLADDIDGVQLAAPEPSEPPAWTSVTADQLAAAVAKLDDEFRAVYERHVEGRSYQAIASELGIPVNTVGTRLSRARSKLRALLEAALAAQEVAR
jgi:RNA polymerase sigma-70 factor (ECF subfamily)